MHAQSQTSKAQTSPSQISLSLMRVDRSQHRRVTAIFAGSDVSFLVPKTATLGELAERLALIAEPHGGLETAVAVRLSA